MHYLSIDFIPGMSVGLRIYSDPSQLEDGDKLVIVVDLLIISFTYILSDVVE